VLSLDQTEALHSRYTFVVNSQGGNYMKTRYVAMLSMLAGATLGALSIGGLYAQGKAPGAYAIIAFTDVGEPAAYKANVLDKALEPVKKYGGQFIVRTTEITSLRPLPAGEPPLVRYVIIGFDDAQQAKTWYGSEEQKAINAYVNEHTKGRIYLVPAFSQ
jgi:uncharacterized protein (DUF1330 family)